MWADDARSGTGRAGSIARAGVIGVALAAMFATACSGDDATPDLSSLPTAADIDLVATEMAYTPDRVAVEAGEIPVRLVNEGAVRHDLRIEGVPFLVEAEPGETETATVQLEPGSYVLFCSIPGHREAGMTGFLEVR